MKLAALAAVPPFVTSVVPSKNNVCAYAVAAACVPLLQTSSTRTSPACASTEFPDTVTTLPVVAVPHSVPSAVELS